MFVIKQLANPKNVGLSLLSRNLRYSKIIETNQCNKQRTRSNAKVGCDQKLQDIKNTLDNICGEMKNKLGSDRSLEEINKKLDKIYCETIETKKMVATFAQTQCIKSSGEKKLDAQTNPKCSEVRKQGECPSPLQPAPSRPVQENTCKSKKKIQGECPSPRPVQEVDTCKHKKKKNPFFYVIGLALLSTLGYCIYEHREDEENPERENKEGPQ